MVPVVVWLKPLIMSQLNATRICRVQTLCAAVSCNRTSEACKGVCIVAVHMSAQLIIRFVGSMNDASCCSVAEQTGSGVLRSESHGVGDGRHIALVSATAEPPQVLIAMFAVQIALYRRAWSSIERTP